MICDNSDEKSLTITLITSAYNNVREETEEKKAQKIKKISVRKETTRVGGCCYSTQPK